MSRDYWDGYFSRLLDDGRDLDWGDRWTGAFLPVLADAGATTVLELGCGTGNDAARLARAGLNVTALDLSPEAIERARERYGAFARFLVHDLVEPLPFEDGSFDAVVANVSLHMFAWDDTVRIVAEVERVLNRGGLFLFHVNAREDRPLRARRRAVVRELEPNYVLEEAGQRVRFFSDDELRQLLAEWTHVELDLVEIADEASGDSFKAVWRGVARR